MHRWHKRVLITLPPLIVAGVAFKIIPVGPEVRKKIDSLLSTTRKEEIITRQLSVGKITGEVVMKEKPGLPAVALKGGEILSQGAGLATGPESSIVLHFKGPYSWTLRLGENSRLNIDELMVQKTREETILNLVKGGMVLMLKNQSGALIEIIVRTKFASFSTSDGSFAVLSDGDKLTTMTVKTGAIEAENYKHMSKTIVRDGFTFAVNREGEQKSQIDLDTVDLYDWASDSGATSFPDLKTITENVGDPGPILEDAELKRVETLKAVDEAIAQFKATNLELERELSILSENAEKSREGLQTEKQKIEKDIKCLQTSESECLLSSERILMNQSFPRMWGTKSYRNEMVVGLQKYLQERELEIRGREDEAAELKKLMTLRRSVVQKIETQRSSENDIEKIIPILQDARLRR